LETHFILLNIKVQLLIKCTIVIMSTYVKISRHSMPADPLDYLRGGQTSLFDPLSLKNRVGSAQWQYLTMELLCSWEKVKLQW